VCGVKKKELAVNMAPSGQAIAIAGSRLVVLLSADVERPAADMLVAPLDDELVVAGLRESVLDDVLEVVHVHDAQLFARHARTRDADQQHVVAWHTAQTHAVVKKVKFSHTRYRALGPELIPVYRQSARR